MKDLEKFKTMNTNERLENIKKEIKKLQTLVTEFEESLTPREANTIKTIMSINTHILKEKIESLSILKH